MESIRNPLAKPPKYIDVDYMTLPDIDSNPLFYDEDAQEMLTYWTDGKWSTGILTGRPGM